MRPRSTTPFIIGVILVSVSVLPTLLFAQEHPFERAQGKVGTASFIHLPSFPPFPLSLSGTRAYSTTHCGAVRAGGGAQVENPFRRTLLAFRGIRGPVLRACIVFFLSWAAYFPFSTNATTYVGSCIYNRTVTHTSASAFPAALHTYTRTRTCISHVPHMPLFGLQIACERRYAARYDASFVNFALISCRGCCRRRHAHRR